MLGRSRTKHARGATPRLARAARRPSLPPRLPPNRRSRPTSSSDWRTSYSASTSSFPRSAW